MDSPKHSKPPAKGGPCCHCGTFQTPCWRKGPPEKHILCNACGVRFLVKGDLAGYLPGAKPRRKMPALKPASKVINIVPSSKGFEDSKRRRKVTKRFADDDAYLWDVGYVTSDSEQMSGPYTKRARVQYVDVADKAVQCNFSLSPVAGSSDEGDEFHVNTLALLHAVVGESSSDSQTERPQGSRRRKQVPPSRAL